MLRVSRGLSADGDDSATRYPRPALAAESWYTRLVCDEVRWSPSALRPPPTACSSALLRCLRRAFSASSSATRARSASRLARSSWSPPADAPPPLVLPASAASPPPLPALGRGACTPTSTSANSDLVDCVRDSSTGVLPFSASCTADTSLASAACCCAAWSSSSCSLGSTAVTGGRATAAPGVGAGGGLPSGSLPASLRLLLPVLAPSALMGSDAAALRLAEDAALEMPACSMTRKRPFFLGSTLISLTSNTLLAAVPSPPPPSPTPSPPRLLPSSDTRACGLRLSMTGAAKLWLRLLLVVSSA
mmetsp:Transcript_35268/g.89242  ORF Transcript_35268/g.89242 Transcript_35268/m.89242 type:complete len:304 (-) Transcript_35268:1984-2895(-)